MALLARLIALSTATNRAGLIRDVHLMVTGTDYNDEAILALLREDGRMSFRDMSARLDLSETTIRSRIRKMEQSGLMRVVARVDLKLTGFPFTALIGLKVRGRAIEDVGADLAEISEIISILAVIGRSDLEIQVIAKTLEELDDLIYNRISRVEGIASLETAIASQVRKYEQPWGQFS